MQKVAKRYPKARKIIVIQDNLNTHTPSAFYESMRAKEAFELSKRFEMVYTPKKASWLNMTEIEFSAMSKQCLDRRIGRVDILEKEVAAWVKKRNKNRVRITWQFTKNHARTKFERFYDSIIKN